MKAENITIAIADLPNAIFISSIEDKMVKAGLLWEYKKDVQKRERQHNIVEQVVRISMKENKVVTIPIDPSLLLIPKKVTEGLLKL